MESNKVELIGGVNYIAEPKSTANGGLILTVLLGKKKYNKEEYDSFRIKLFGDTAHSFADTIKKGDRVRIIGRLSSDTYEKDGKKVTTMEVVANSFDKVEYDAKAKDYVIVGEPKQQGLDDLFAD